MTNTPTILITGAAGNLGAKLRRHWQGRYPLRLLDRDPRGDPAVVAADLANWDLAWADLRWKRRRLTTTAARAGRTLRNCAG